jgi:hypothetical protein
MDDLIKLATGGISSTSAMGEGVTESTHPRLNYQANIISTIHSVQKSKTLDTRHRHKTLMYE